MVVRVYFRRALVGLLILIAIASTALFPLFIRASQRRAAVDHVQSIGGTAYYDWQLTGTSGPTTAEDFVRDFLSNPALLATVSHVDLRGTSASDDDLQMLLELDAIEYLFITDCAMSDSVVAEFESHHPNCRVTR